MTLGDVLAVIAFAAGGGMAWGALLLVLALAFPAKTGRAAAAIQARPWACAGWGALLLVGLVLVSLIFMNVPGPGQLLAWTIWIGLGLTSALGCAGLAGLLADRIGAAGTTLSPFAARTRAAFLLTLAGFLPLIGWALIGPATLLLGLGGARAALRPARRAAPLTSPTDALEMAA